MENQAVADNQIVEEYPSPPLYYQLFKTIDYLDKPTIPVSIVKNSILNNDNLEVFENKEQTNHILNPYLIAYNGRFAHIQENKLQYNPKRDYKTDLKLTYHNLISSLKSILDNSLKFLSYQDPTINNIDLNVIELRNSIYNMHQILHEYREHEARELLCDNMEKQLNDIKEIETILEKTLIENQKLLEDMKISHTL